jgi:hypothetical protein
VSPRSSARSLRPGRPATVQPAVAGRPAPACHGAARTPGSGRQAAGSPHPSALP